jgi:hypothetical protein
MPVRSDRPRLPGGLRILIDRTMQKVKPGDRLPSDLSITERQERPIVFKTPEELAEG